MTVIKTGTIIIEKDGRVAIVGFATAHTEHPTEEIINWGIDCLIKAKEHKLEDFVSIKKSGATP